MDLFRLYDVYVEYARRETDLLYSSVNWLWAGNAVFLIALAFIAQEQLKLTAAGGMAIISDDVYTNTLYLLSRVAFLVVPILALVYNFSMWGFMAAAVRAHHTIRLKWRSVKDQFPNETSDLPFLSYGFFDEGGKVPNSYAQCGALPVACILGWSGFLGLAVWTAGVMMDLVPPLPSL